MKNSPTPLHFYATHCLLSIIASLILCSGTPAHGKETTANQRGFEVVIQAPPNHVETLAVSPNGKLAATVGDGTAILWDTQAGKIIRTLSVEPTRLGGLIFSPDSQRLLLHSASPPSLQVHAVSTGEVIRSIPIDSELVVRHFAISPDKRFIGGILEKPFQSDTFTKNSKAIVLDLDSWAPIKASHSIVNSIVRRLPKTEHGYLSSMHLPIDEIDAMFTADEENSEISTITLFRNGRRAADLRANECLEIYSCLSAADSSSFIAASGNQGDHRGFVQVWNTEKWQQTAYLRTQGRAESCAFIPNDGRLLIGLTASKYNPSYGGLAVLDDPTKPISRRLPFPGYLPQFKKLQISSDGKLLAATGEFGELQIWDLGQLALRISIDMHIGFDNSVETHFSPNTDKIICRASNCSETPYAEFVYSTTTGMLLEYRPPANKSIVSLGYENDIKSPSGRFRARAVTKDGNIKNPTILRLKKPAAIQLTETGSGKILHTLEGHTSFITALLFTPDEKTLISSSLDHTIRLWNTETGECVVLAGLVGESKEWIAYTDDGYFDASSNGGGLVGISLGENSYNIEQFASTHNRPDILVSRLWPSKKQLINRFSDQHALRLRRFGLVDDSPKAIATSKIPTISIIDSKIDGAILSLVFRMESSESELDSWTISANGTPVKEYSGIPANGHSLNSKARVMLSDGPNRIEISCLNSSGVESPRATYSCMVAKNPKREVYFLGLGISKYENPEWNLGYAAKDVIDMSELTTRMGQIGGFSQSHVRTLLDNQVTHENLIDARKWLANAALDDVVVVFLAGHGFYSKGSDPGFRFLTSGFDEKRTAETTLPFSAIEDILREPASRRKLLLIDSCQSGEIDPDLAESYTVTAVKAGSRIPRAGPAVARFSGSPDPILKDDPAENPRIADRNRFIFNDVLRRTGAIVFSSCAGHEFSYEHPRFKNGLFTEALLEGLGNGAADSDNDGGVTIHELRDYVAHRVALLSDGYQNPWTDRDNPLQHISLPITDNKGLERRVLTAFIEEYLRRSSSSSGSSDNDELNMISDQADYFGVNRSLDDIRKMILANEQKWPYRLYQLSSDVAILPSESKEDRNLRYTVRSNEYAANSSTPTSASHEISMRVRRIGDKWKIVGLKYND